MDIKPVYLFYGEESYLIWRDLNYFLRHFSGEEGTSTALRFNGAKTSLATILDSAEEVPLFGSERLIIVENAPWFTGAEENIEPLVKYLDQPNENSCLVFVAEKADKRLKVVKAVEKIGKVRRYDKYKPWELPDYIARYLAKHNKRITAAASDLLVQLAGENLGVISGELDKLLLGSDNKAYIDEKDVERIVAETASASMFHLADAINRRNLPAIQNISTKLLEEMPVQEYSILQGFIANHLRLLLQVKELAAAGKSEKAIANTLKIHEYRVKKTLLAVKHYEYQALERGLTTIMEMDNKIKTGRAAFASLFPVLLTQLSIS